jgi:hypothetical protein
MWHSVLKQRGYGRRLSHRMKKGDKGRCMENFMMLVIHRLTTWLFTGKQVNNLW